MTQPNNGVTTQDSPTDDRGIPLQNLQAEMSRKLEAIETKMAERLEAINQKLEAFSTEPDPVPEETAAPYDKRKELVDISADPPRYVERFTKPLEEKISFLEKQLNETKTLTVKGMWEKMEDTIARLEGKKDWKELPADTQNGIVNIVKEKGWVNNPSSALDAYELFQARKAKQDASDPNRVTRINSGTTEGSGRFSGKTPVKTLTRSAVEELASTHPRHSDYKKNMDTLAKIQSGEIRIE